MARHDGPLMPGATVEAAGGVLWRGDAAAPEVAVVHRPRYDDWSLPKGKLDFGEHPLLGALREIAEETGFAARPGRRLGSLRYPVVEGPKRVRYWACEATAGEFTPNREVDQLVWLPVPDALARLSPTHDRPVLQRYADDTRRTRVLAVVRHASAGDKKGWTGADAERPLDAAGAARARTIAALLSAYDVSRLASADVLRCTATLEPFARRTGTDLVVLPSTTAGVFDGAPEQAVAAVADLLDGSGSAAWCGQREVIPELVAGVCAALGTDGTRGIAVDADDFTDLRKGALLLLHVDDRRTVVAVERLPG
jgi:8-oxo-dGTP diphosphatase